MEINEYLLVFLFGLVFMIGFILGAIGTAREAIKKIVGGFEKMHDEGWRLTKISQ
jgi:hypothetical protein